MLALISSRDSIWKSELSFISFGMSSSTLLYIGPLWFSRMSKCSFLSVPIVAAIQKIFILKKSLSVVRRTVDFFRSVENALCVLRISQ